jgi:hypothetical protein
MSTGPLTRGDLARVRAELTTSKPAVTIGLPDGVGVCVANLASLIKTTAASAWTYTDDCAGDISPVVCTSQATLQIEDPRDTSLGWGIVDSGSTESGCSGEESITSVKCAPDGYTWYYRVRGIFRIDWDNGDVTGPDDEYSSPKTVGTFCS